MIGDGKLEILTGDDGHEDEMERGSRSVENQTSANDQLEKYATGIFCCFVGLVTLAWANSLPYIYIKNR